MREYKSGSILGLTTRPAAQLRLAFVGTFYFLIFLKWNHDNSLCRSHPELIQAVGFFLQTIVRLVLFLYMPRWYAQSGYEASVSEGAGGGGGLSQKKVDSSATDM